MTDHEPSTDRAPLTPVTFIILSVSLIVLGVMFLRDGATIVGAALVIGGAGAGLYGIIAAAVSAGVKSARDNNDPT